MKKLNFSSKSECLIVPIFFLILGFVAFHKNMYFGLDGSYFCWLSNLVKANSYNVFGLSMNHFQGNSSMQFPVNFLTNLTFLISIIFPLSTKTSIYIASSIIVFVSSIIISNHLSFSMMQKILFSVLCSASLLPMPLGFYGIADCSPVMPELAMLTCLVLVMLLNTGKSTKNFIFIFIIILYLLNISPVFLIYLSPLIAIFFFKHLNYLTCIKHNKNILKNPAFFLFGCCTILIFFTCIWALGHLVTSPAYFFKNQIKDPLTVLDVSFIFWGGKRWPAIALVFLSYVIAFFNIKNNKFKIIKKISRILLIFFLFQIIAFIMISFGHAKIRLVSITYFEYLLIPLNMIMISSLFYHTKVCYKSFEK